MLGVSGYAVVKQARIPSAYYHNDPYGILSANLFYLRVYDGFLGTIVENNLIWRVKILCGKGPYGFSVGRCDQIWNPLGVRMLL